MGDKTEYNGWTNYATWCISLWLNNDEVTQSFYIEEARTIKNNPEYIEIREELILRKPLARLEEFIKKEIEKSNPLYTKKSSLYMDVLTHALAHVNYREIAKSFLEGL